MKVGENMTIRDDLLFDFAVNLPRVLVAGRTTVLDNVRKLMLLTDSEIIVYNGQRYTSVRGDELTITQLMEERMLISGEVKEIRFFKALQEDKN